MLNTSIPRDLTAEPMPTRLAPAIIISTASFPVEIPPRPMTGMETALKISYTHLTATGFIMGPDRPPVLKASTGIFDSMSIIIPGPAVLIAHIASAPAFSHAFAILPMLRAWGVSLTIRGTSMTFFTAETTLNEAFSSTPKIIPCLSEFGQEIFISIKSGFLSETNFATISNSSTEPP